MPKRKKVYNFPMSGNMDVHEFNDIYINELSEEIYRNELEPYPDYVFDEEKVDEKNGRQKRD